MTRNELALHYEVVFDVKTMSILFMLCPEANDYFLQLSRERMIESRLSPFSFSSNSWGYGNVFKLNRNESFAPGWTTWECFLPFKAKQKVLDDVSGSIVCLINAMQFYSYDKRGCGHEGRIQFMTIDDLAVFSENHFNSGAFSYSFARPVLEFCSRIWKNDQLHAEIIEAMQKTWAHLAGKKKLTSWEKQSFRIGQCQGDPRLISLTCPGNCS
jgi:hypothetical protein